MQTTNEAQPPHIFTAFSGDIPRIPRGYEWTTIDGPLAAPRQQPKECVVDMTRIVVGNTVTIALQGDEVQDSVLCAPHTPIKIDDLPPGYLASLEGYRLQWRDFLERTKAQLQRAGEDTSEEFVYAGRQVERIGKIDPVEALGSTHKIGNFASPDDCVVGDFNVTSNSPATTVRTIGNVSYGPASAIISFGVYEVTKPANTNATSCQEGDIVVAAPAPDTM